MSWLVLLEQWIVQLASHVPLVVYLLIGEVVEEVVSPIPSQAVLITAGSIAQAQHWPIIGLVLLAFIAALAKTGATMAYFLLAGKLEETLLPRVGKYLGITKGTVAAIGRHLDKGGPKEFLSLFAIRCLPILPSVPVSVACGLLKINGRNFFLATFCGNLVRGWMVLLTGFLGFDVLAAFAKGGLSARTAVATLILALLIGFFGWGYWKRYRTPAEPA